MHFNTNGWPDNPILASIDINRRGGHGYLGLRIQDYYNRPATEAKKIAVRSCLEKASWQEGNRILYFNFTSFVWLNKQPKDVGTIYMNQYLTDLEYYFIKGHVGMGVIFVDGYTEALGTSIIRWNGLAINWGKITTQRRKEREKHLISTGVDNT